MLPRSIVKHALAAGVVTAAVPSFQPALATPHEHTQLADNDAAAAAFLHQDLATLTALATGGDAVAQNYLGTAYFLGRGAPQDYAAALIWYQKAADQNLADAQFVLGMMYADGRGVPQNYVTAASLLRKAADQGHAFAQDSLGRWYERGDGVPQSYVDAVNWYRKAAEQGHASAQDNLGLMYIKGLGVAQDYTAANLWLRKAAEQGYARAQNDLGLLYANGLGVPRDFVEAYKWFDLSAAAAKSESSREEATRNRDEAASGMTSAQIGEAQKQVKAWQAARKD